MSHHDVVITTGDKAPVGRYYCDKCGYEYEHKDENEPMPRCPDEGIFTIWNEEKLRPRFAEGS